MKHHGRSGAVIVAIAAACGLGPSCRQPPPIAWRDATTTPPEAIDRLAATTPPLFHGLATEVARDYFRFAERGSHIHHPPGDAIGDELASAFDEAWSSLSRTSRARRLLMLQRLAYTRGVRTLYWETQPLVARRLVLEFPVADWALDDIAAYLEDTPPVDLTELAARARAAAQDLGRLSLAYGAARSRDVRCRQFVDMRVAQVRTQVRNLGGDWSTTTTPFYGLLASHDVDTHPLQAESMPPMRGCPEPDAP